MSGRNAIPDRIAGTLRRFPPFSMLSERDVRALAGEATVRVFVAGDRLWSQGDRPGGELLFLARGRVEYARQEGDQSELVDVRDMGDVLGLTALLRDEPFRVTAQVVEDSLFYGLPWPGLRLLLETNDAARQYARRHQFWATRVGGAISLPEPAETATAGRAKNILQAHLEGARVIVPRDPDRLLTCPRDETIGRAATRMAGLRVPSILVVDEARRPLGIVTNSGLVRQVVVGGVDKAEPVETIMSSPVVTVASRSSAMAALLLMLRERIGQVCVTEDGTPGTAALDVCTDKDLLAQSGHHPAGLLREIRHAVSPARFRELCDEVEGIARGYLEAGVSGVYVGQMCAELYDELVARLIVLAERDLHARGVDLPAVAWAWMSVGSDGRREQILRTDMDNALVFAAAGEAADDERHRAVFLQLAARVVEMLVESGFARCQGGVMASNPRWCRTDREWLSELGAIADNVSDEGLLRALVLYDMRFVAGTKAACDTVRAAVFDSVAANNPLQHRLGESIVDTPPPLNFWGRFVVEKRGGREGEFDLKQRAMAPLRDAARLLCLKHRLTHRYSTGGRWEDIRRSVPRLAELATLARDGYDHLLRVRTLNGLRRGDSGRFVDPTTLTKLERDQLANVFDVVRMVQTSVRLEFQLEVRR
jgi:CBS domain-containing protein